MHRDGKRLHHHRLLHPNVLRQLVAEFGLRLEEARQRAVRRVARPRRRGERHGVTEVVVPAHAVGAASAGVAWFDGNAVAGLESFDAGTDGGDGARGFVAHD